MLYLDAPFYLVDGVSILRDHVDPLQFYFMPLSPRITTVVDTATGAAVPQVNLIKFRGTAGTGGILSLDVNLGLDDERRKKIEAKLQTMGNLRERPRLAPIPLIGGTVKLVMLGVDSTEPTPATPAGSPRFVTKIEHHVSPSLYGINQATFSVQLDESGVVALEKAIQGELAPIGVVYSLEYLALRPLYAYKVHADWNRVQTHFEESFGQNAFFSSVEVTTAIDKLIEDRVIDIQEDTFILENTENTDILARRDAVVAEVQRMVLDKFFEVSLAPVPLDQPDETMEKVNQVAMLLATGGLGGAFSTRYRKVDLTRIDQKTSNVNVNERGAVKQTIHPQGHLQGLFSVLRQPGIDLGRFVTSVDLDDPYFKKRKLGVIPRANFPVDSIASLDVRLEYQGNVTNCILEKEGDRPTVEWASVLQNGAMVREVDVSYRVTFKDVDTSERPLVLESAHRKVDVDALEIQPRELYTMSDVPILAIGFPWEKYPTVEVRCRYKDEANSIALADDFILKAEKTEDTWRMFLRDRTRTAFDYQVVFRAADHRDITLPYTTTADEQIVIRDPRPAKLSLSVVPNIKWTEVERVFVDLVYRDDVNGLREEASLEFNKEQPGPQSFRVALEDPELRTVEYTVTVLMLDGTKIEVPRSRTLSARIFIRSDMRGHKVVQVKTKPIPFAERKLEKIIVEMRYADAAGGLSFAEDLVFERHDGRPGVFELDYVAPDRESYTYRVTYAYKNGLRRSTDWVTSKSEELTIPVE
jgi:hypothetical protein